MNRDKEKELIADLLRLLKRYKDYDAPYIRNDGDIVIPLEACLKKNREAIVTLNDFSIYYSQDTLQKTGEVLGKGKSTVILDNGKILKISKDKAGIIKQEEVATNWIDWIDYWSIDFNYEDRPELVITESEDGKLQQVETGRFVFDNNWQSFKTIDNEL